MMGKGHAVLGTATWCAGVTYAFPALGWDTNPLILTLGALPVAGAALRPDIDHPSATMANSGGFITKGVAHLANAVSGGHREGTHRLWFWLACAVFDFTLTATFGQPAAMGLFFLYTAFGAQALAKSTLFRRMNRRWRSNTGIFAKLWCWAFAAAATAGAYFVFPEPQMWWWLPIGVTVGHATHLVGDAMTTQGWEWTQGHTLRFPILGDAGSERETILTWALGVVTVIFIVTSFGGIDPMDLIRSLRETLGGKLA